MRTNTLRTDLIPLPLSAAQRAPYHALRYSPLSNECMASLQEKASSPWAARVCSSDQPTRTECCSQAKCAQPVWTRFISSRTEPYRSALPACTPAQQGGSCLESGDYRLSHVRGLGRAARLDTKGLASVVNISVSCKLGGAHVHEPCSAHSTRAGETSEIQSKMKELCGQNHTVAWFVLHKAGQARGS